MREERGNIWTWWEQDYWMIITTNGHIKTSGDAVMGRGVAEQVKRKWREFPRLLGKHLDAFGNVPGYFAKYRLITLPVKYYWADSADINLIRKSIADLDYVLSDGALKPEKIVSVRPGCGNGYLSWDQIRPVVEPVYTKHDILVVEYK